LELSQRYTWYCTWQMVDKPMATTAMPFRIHPKAPANVSAIVHQSRRRRGIQHTSTKTTTSSLSIHGHSDTMNGYTAWLATGRSIFNRQPIRSDSSSVLSNDPKHQRYVVHPLQKHSTTSWTPWNHGRSILMAHDNVCRPIYLILCFNPRIQRRLWRVRPTLYWRCIRLDSTQYKPWQTRRNKAWDHLEDQGHNHFEMRHVICFYS
jgi:hypothetical protein